ncbi:DMT family transporter [Jannaschia sp. W003]|uniref:DMT family transporter n=1 Tax=Jannaschia sp. W003 TaxID=2867012 RepID=UPI0021A6F3AB|nr:DMT family transporter [Jannaschia sp. W003]UWQ21298.1 DMT family transporter [Jannaschia sp. W003]
MVQHALVMLLAGIGIPVLAALNARLGANIGGPAAAAVVLFAVAAAAAVATMLLTSPEALLRVPGQPPHLFAAGLLVAFYVLSITWIAPRFGVGNAVFFVLLGQLVSASAIDFLGLLGARPVPVSGLRVAGLVLMAAGLALTQLAPRG